MAEELSAKQAMKPRIAIVGAGNLASAMATALHAAGYVIDQIVSRGRAACSQRARRLAGELGSYAVTAARAQLHAEVVWFCVPDRAIAASAESLSEVTDWRGKSGLAFQRRSQQRRTREPAATRRGGRIGSSADDVCSRLAAVAGGVPFAIEGDRRAVRAARAIVTDLRGKPFSIRKQGQRGLPRMGNVRFSVTNRAAGGERESGRIRWGSAERSKRADVAHPKTDAGELCGFGCAAIFQRPDCAGRRRDREEASERATRGAGSPEVYLALARAALRDLPTKNRATLGKILKR